MHFSVTLIAWDESVIAKTFQNYTAREKQTSQIVKIQQSYQQIRVW